MKKIIHLTDTHINDDEKLPEGAMETVIKKITDFVNASNTQPSDYVIVHTGDVISSDKGIKDYSVALEHFKELKKRGFTLLFVPGNHDYGPGFNSIDEKCKDQFNQFRTLFYDQQSACYPNKVDAPYPLVNIIDDIAFIGLDSLGGREFGFLTRRFIWGKFGDTQLNNLSAMLDASKDTENKYVALRNCKYKVVYLHYHPDDFNPATGSEISGSDSLKTILRTYNNNNELKISALLFGHNHGDGQPYLNEASTWGIQRAYDGGCSTAFEGKPSPFRVIDLSTHPKEDNHGCFLAV